MKKSELYKGLKIILKKDIKTKCCNNIITKDTEVEIFNFESLARGIPLKKYVNISIKGCLHKVKISSL